MIIVFPMLVSRAVSENSIPGIAKTLENYIIVHKQDMIMSSVNKQKRRGGIGTLFRAAGGFKLKEGENLSEALPPGAEEGSKNKTMYDQEHDILDKEWKNLEKREAEIERKEKELDREERKAKSEEERSRLAREKQELEREKFEHQKRKDEIKQKQDEIKRVEDQLEKDEERKAKAKEKQAEDEAKRAHVNVKMGDVRTVALEPTYITIENVSRDGVKTTSMLGIKVVPYRVKADVKLSHLILYDSQVNNLSASMIALGRRLTGWFYRVFDKWTRRLRLMGGLSPSGDPRRDIIMGRTGMGKESEGFIILSKQEDIDEYFIDNISRINRLFKMGWGNFVIADDIGRTAYFCMKSFRGLCNSIPYAMMYDRLGQTKAYETMEDAKKANSSIFKVSARFSRVIGEWKVEQKMLKYNQLNEGINDE